MSKSITQPKLRGGAGRGQGRKPSPAQGGPLLWVMEALGYNGVRMAERLGITPAQVSRLLKAHHAPTFAPARGALLTLACGIESEKRTSELQAWIEAENEFWRTTPSGVFI